MRRKISMFLLAPIPALCIGAIVMHAKGIGPMVYGQNILCYGILALLVFLLSPRDVRFTNPQPMAMGFLALCCIVLAVTFFDKGLDNVHRWLAIGSFRIYGSSLILPAAIVGLSILLRGERRVVAVSISAIIAVLLVLQPDASQLTAFAAGIAVLCWMGKTNRILKYGVSLAGIMFVIYAWINLDALAPVPHVEEILFLALDMGVMWFILGILSLVLLLIPFFTVFRGYYVAIALGCYYAVVIASTFVGNFPVPFMGQGISPIIGYLLAVYLLFQTRRVERV